MSEFSFQLLSSVLVCGIKKAKAYTTCRYSVYADTIYRICRPPHPHPPHTLHLTCFQSDPEGMFSQKKTADLESNGAFNTKLMQA